MSLTEEKEPLLSRRNSGQRESESDYRRRWTCIYISYLGTFATFIQSSIYWASLWPYLSQVDPTTPESFFGLIISAYAFGSVLSAPLLGWWSNRIKSTKWPILLGFVVNVGGNLLMAFVEGVNGPLTNRRWVMLAARFIAGAGSGNNGVTMAFLAHASTLEERDRVMGYQAATLSCAVLLGPGLAAAFSPIGYPGWVLGPLHLDMYTLEAWISALFSILCIILYATVYREFYVGIDHDDLAVEDEFSYIVPEDKFNAALIEKRQSRLEIEGQELSELEEMSNENDTVKTKSARKSTQSELHAKSNLPQMHHKRVAAPMPPVDKVAAFNCILVRFVMLFCVVYDDTIGSPFTMAMFNWNRSDAVLYNGLIQAFSGIIDFVGNIFVGVFLLKYVRERNTIVLGIVFFALFYLIAFSWPWLPAFEPPAMAPGGASNFTTPATVIGNSTLSNIDTTTVDPDQNLGCIYEWCAYTTRISVPQYLVAYLFLVMAFSTAFTPTSTLFSKVLGNRRQGLWQGVFTAAGSLAMTISPVFVSSLFEAFGPRVCWLAALAVIAVTLASLGLGYRRLIPPPDEDRRMPMAEPKESECFESVAGYKEIAVDNEMPRRSGRYSSMLDPASSQEHLSTEARSPSISASPRHHKMSVRHLSRYQTDEDI